LPRAVRRPLGAHRDQRRFGLRRLPSAPSPATRSRLAGASRRRALRRLEPSLTPRRPRYDRAAAMTRIKRIPRPVAVEVLPPFAIRVTFDDGVVHDTDLADDLWGPMFEPLKDPAYFAQVKVEDGNV